TNRHVGVQRQIRNRVGMLVLKPVETPHLVRAVVLAIARANAAVVDLHVQALAAVNRRQNRTHALTGGVITLVAHDRLIGHTRLFRPVNVSIESYPMHLALSADLIFADNRNIVFSLTTQHACRAADAGVEVYNHRPLVLAVLMVLPDAPRLCRMLAALRFPALYVFVKAELFDQ